MSGSRAFDRVIVSSNDDPRYYQSWPLVVAAWQKFWPGVPVTLVLVADRAALIQAAAKYGEVVVYPPIGGLGGIPTGNQAKIARFCEASKRGREVCVVHDIDTVPLQREWRDRLYAQREPGKLLAVGAEVYDGTPHGGKFPAADMCGQGDDFAALFGTDSWRETMGRMATWKPLVCHKEDIRAKDFSDESLIRALRWRCPGAKLQHIKREVDIHEDWIDRSWWRVDVAKLKRGGYVECNLPRPMLGEHGDEADKVAPITEYLTGRWPDAVALCA